jgi:hypothetical protein
VDASPGSSSRPGYGRAPRERGGGAGRCGPGSPGVQESAAARCAAASRAITLSDTCARENAHTPADMCSQEA